MIDEIHLNSHKFHQSSVTKQIACKPKPSSTKEDSCHLPPFHHRDHRNLLSFVTAVVSSQPSPVRRIADTPQNNSCSSLAQTVLAASNFNGKAAAYSFPSCISGNAEAQDGFDQLQKTKKLKFSLQSSYI
ncbi:hypothetical protein Q3G72_025525 [Acer saccharum]|nr:hypothetical protein Q3G72_025525 [Acer saccharum]